MSTEQKSVPKTDSTPASASDSQQTTPGAVGSTATTSIGASVGTANGNVATAITLGSMMTISLSLIAHLIFSYGAAKLSYDMFGSVGWAILDFIFSWFYYPYYALFLNKPAPSLGVVGAGRRR